MRDRYLKEVRMENKSKKQGEIFQSRWKYRQLMNFIAPFTGSRSGEPDISGNNDDHDNLDNEAVSPGGETASSETMKTSQSHARSLSQQEVKPQVAYVTQLPQDPSSHTQLAAAAKAPSGSSNTNKRKRHLMPDSHSLNSSQMPPTKWLVKDNGASFTNRPRDEDELFLLSFVPALKRLAPQKRCETKMKIQQIMYEAEFNVPQPEPQEKQAEPDAQD
ncbi:uncharacterized protein LOC117830911 isoform X2 [Notolabrus celidotus]|nr:uncharacterized protein LOC117830911 isoform X2 [Notolabrus celidotus]